MSMKSLQFFTVGLFSVCILIHNVHDNYMPYCDFACMEDDEGAGFWNCAEREAAI
jgi:hypothetical protein